MDEFEFNRSDFAGLLLKAKGSRRISEMASACQIDIDTLTEYIAQSSEEPPEPETLELIADFSGGSVSLDELLDVCGWELEPEPETTEPAEAELPGSGLDEEIYDDEPEDSFEFGEPDGTQDELPQHGFDFSDPDELDDEEGLEEVASNFQFAQAKEEKQSAPAQEAKPVTPAPEAKSAAPAPEREYVEEPDEEPAGKPSEPYHYSVPKSIKPMRLQVSSAVPKKAETHFSGEDVRDFRKPDGGQKAGKKPGYAAPGKPVNSATEKTVDEAIDVPVGEKAERDIPQVGSTQIGGQQVGSAQIGGQQVGSAQIGSAQSSYPQREHITLDNRLETLISMARVYERLLPEYPDLEKTDIEVWETRFVDWADAFEDVYPEEYWDSHDYDEEVVAYSQKLILEAAGLNKKPFYFRFNGRRKSCFPKGYVVVYAKDMATAVGRVKETYPEFDLTKKPMIGAAYFSAYTEDDFTAAKTQGAKWAMEQAAQIIK